MFPRGVVANVLQCDIVVSEYELQSRYYVHFYANIFGKGMFFYKNCFGIK